MTKEKLDSNNIGDLRLLANKQYVNRNYSEAIAIWKKMLRLSLSVDDRADMNYNIGYTLHYHLGASRAEEKELVVRYFANAIHYAKRYKHEATFVPVETINSINNGSYIPFDEVEVKPKALSSGWIFAAAMIGAGLAASASQKQIKQSKDRYAN